MAQPHLAGFNAAIKHLLPTQVDVYSLGIIMCQLFGGATPYAGMSMPAVLFAVVHQGQRPDVPSDMPDDYKALMQCCWDSDPHNRYNHCSAAIPSTLLAFQQACRSTILTLKTDACCLLGFFAERL